MSTWHFEAMPVDLGQENRDGEENNSSKEAYIEGVDFLRVHSVLYEV